MQVLFFSVALIDVGVFYYAIRLARKAYHRDRNDRGGFLQPDFHANVIGNPVFYLRATRGGDRYFEHFFGHRDRVEAEKLTLLLRIFWALVLFQMIGSMIVQPILARL